MRQAVLFFAGGGFGVKFRLPDFREIALGSRCELLSGAEYIKLNGSFYFIWMKFVGEKSSCYIP
jgi:hypothetical protein